MIDLFYQGGPLFMGILSLLLLTVLILAGRSWMKVSAGEWDEKVARRNVSYIKSVGVLAFVFGVLGQLIGLYSAFIAIEEMGNVSPTMLAGGLRVSMITTLYGALILIISMLIWLFMDASLKGSTGE